MELICFLGWRKMSCYFNLSYEIKDKTIEFDENRNVQRAEFVVRAYMQYVFPFFLLDFVNKVIKLKSSVMNIFVASLSLFYTLSLFLGVGDSQMDGAHVNGVRRGF